MRAGGRITQTPINNYISLTKTHFFPKKYNWGNAITVVLSLLEKHRRFFFRTPFFIHRIRETFFLSFSSFSFFLSGDRHCFNYVYKANAVKGMKTCKQNSMRVKDQNAALFTNLRKQ